MANTIVICSDEHHPKMTGYRGHPIVKTPYLDQLAQDGTSFNSAYCNCPVCTPSRMSFITGRYVYDIENWFIGVPLDPTIMTWPRELDQAGIRSTMLGKMDFCGEYQDGGFSDYKIVKARGAYNVYPWQTPFEARLDGYDRPDKLQHLQEAGTREELLARENDYGEKVRNIWDYYDHDRKVIDWTLEYIEEVAQKQSDEPWCLFVGLLYPHWPFVAPKEFFDMYYPNNIEMPMDGRFPNPDMHPELQHFQDALNLCRATEDDWRRAIAAYYGMITCMDSMIGELMEALRKHGMYDDINIVYTSDHGDSVGEHGLCFKHSSYEGSAGVPLVVKPAKGMPCCKTVEQPVSLVDLYPTVLDFYNMKPSTELPGESWLPLMQGETERKTPFVFSEYHGTFLKQGWFMIAWETYRYTYYPNMRPTLFDLATDPDECKNLAEDPAYQDICNKCEEMLRSVCNPDEICLQAKEALGLIAPDGSDYTETLTVQQAREGRQTGRFEPMPVLSDYGNFKIDPKDAMF